MNKQEIIEEIKSVIEVEEVFSILGGCKECFEAKFTAHQFVLNLIERLEENKKVAVPQFVADWYEQTGKCTEWFNWFYKWGRSEETSTLESWVIDWMQDFNEKAFVDMFHNGYEIEKESLYYIKFSEKQYAQKFNENRIDSILVNDKTMAGRFTEKEIQMINPDFMAFAVKVEGVE